MTPCRTALLLAALALCPALLPACADARPVVASEPAAAPQAAVAGQPTPEQEAALKLAAEQTTAERVAAQHALQQRIAAERVAAEAQMRRTQENAEAVAAREKARAESEQRAAELAALEATKGKTAEQVAAQNAAAITLAGKANAPAQAAPAPPAAAAQAPPAEDYSKVVAEIQTSKGSLVLEFFPDVAPRNVKNFVDLARRGFYDGLKFHRIIPGYLIQAGDPAGDGSGGSDDEVKAEWSDRKHHRGTLSMARKGHPDSATSQFFICHQDNAGYDLSTLDGRYTVFGQLVRGYDVLDAIAAVGSPSGEPTATVTMLKVIIRSRQDSDHEPGA